jgi:hypothetical protein
VSSEIYLNDDKLAAAHIEDQRWPEAGNDQATWVSHARVHKAERSSVQECPGHCSRVSIARWNRVGRETFLIPWNQAMELAGKVGKECSMGKVENTVSHRISQGAQSVKVDFLDTCRCIEACVPGATVRTVKPTNAQTSVTEGSIDDCCFRNAKNQLLDRDAFTAALFCFHAFVGRTVQLSQFRKHLFGQAQGVEDGFHAVRG